MWTCVIQRIDVPIDIKEGNPPLLGLKAFAGARGQVVDISNGNEI
jgi:hypothetical protein